MKHSPLMCPALTSPQFLFVFSLMFLSRLLNSLLLSLVPLLPAATHFCRLSMVGCIWEHFAGTSGDTLLSLCSKLSSTIGHKPSLLHFPGPDIVALFRTEGSGDHRQGCCLARLLPRQQYEIKYSLWSWWPGCYSVDTRICNSYVL